MQLLAEPLWMLENCAHCIRFRLFPQPVKGVTHEPLLCYLLVLSGFAAENWEQAAENPNRIYKSLVDSIWQRGWGEGDAKRQGAGRTLSKADFNTLMQTIALAAW